MKLITKKGLQRLIHLRANIDTLKEEEFNYSQFVTKFDKKNNCGTVCCIAGHLPRWYPKQWKWHGSDKYPTLKKNEVEFYRTRIDLCTFFETNSDIILALFYGYPIDELKIKLMRDDEMQNARLPEIKERFDKVIEYLKENITKK